MAKNFLTAIPGVWQALAALIAAAAVGVGITGLGTTRFASKAVEVKVVEIDKEVDMLWQTQIKLSAEQEHIHEEVRETREDLRALFPARLAPLPVESPRPTMTLPPR